MAWHWCVLGLRVRTMFSTKQRRKDLRHGVVGTGHWAFYASIVRACAGVVWSGDKVGAMGKCECVGRVLLCEHGTSVH